MGYLPVLWGILLGALQPGAIHQAAEPLQRFEYKEYHMGVDVRMVVYAPNEPAAVRACGAAFERFAELDSIMSDYRANSELMRLCAKAGGPPVPVSGDLFAILERSHEVAKRSGGAFDVTCGPIVRLWREARKTHVLPTPDQIAAARAVVGWRKMRLDRRRRTVQLLAAGMKLDLGGIGKGYADDCAQKVLRHYGITRALVEAGGDIVVSDPPPGRIGWTIEVPAAATGSKSPELSFTNCAVSTSGDTFQFVDIGGKHWSHVVDPRTGMALTNQVGVTVVAPLGVLSDALSTALSMLPPEQGRALANRYRGVRVYLKVDPADRPGSQTTIDHHECRFGGSASC